jgi:hypothetical protein
LRGLYLHVNDIANTTAPVAVGSKKDSASINVLGGNPWTSIGIWQQ